MRCIMISLMKSVPQRVIIVRKVGTLSRSEQQRVVEQHNECKHELFVQRCLLTHTMNDTKTD